jgi:glyoxylase-like metal-dependent hydrolase (beta-lactamase superfamily II)
LLLPALNPSPMTGQGNNTWLQDGAEPTLIDAGVGVPEHIEAIAAALHGRPLRRVLITHGHADHSAGIPALRARWPDVEVCASEFFSGGGVVPLSDGQVVIAGDGPLTVVYTPGHAIDHVCFIENGNSSSHFQENDSRGLFSGDMVVQGSTVMIPATRGGGLRAYLQSLERLAALKPARIYPGHGPVIDDPIELIESYLEHRRMRDAQVAACIADGVTEPDAIVDRIYPELAPALRPAARATVEAHLQKLAEDQQQ